MTHKLRTLLVLALLALGAVGAASGPGAEPAHAGGPADLFVGSITAQPIEGQVIIQVYVQNLGGTAALNFWIEVQVTGYPTSFIFEDQLAANGTAIYAVTLRDPRGIAKHTVTATADSTQVVAEADEANNALTRQFGW